MRRLHFLLPLGVFFVMSCRNSSDEVPFPSEETEFVQPTAKPFQFTEPLAINWKTVPKDSMKPPTIKKLDLDKIPSKPFVIGKAKVLPQPLTERPLSWNALSDTAMDINLLQTDTMKVRTIKLLPPKVVKPGSPTYVQGLPRGFMDASGIGLPGTARDFLKDPSGALWIATSKGLCRYDGGFLEIYGLEQGLPYIDIVSLFRDHKSRIWAGTFTGDTFVIDEKNGTIQLLEDLFPANQGITYKIIQDDDGRLWIPVFGNGVLVYDAETHIVRNLNFATGLANRVLGMMKDANGAIWMATGRGIFVLDLNAKRMKRLDARSGLLADFTLDIFQASTGEVWTGNAQGVTIIDRSSGRLRFLEKGKQLFVADNKTNVTGISQDPTGKMWMGTNGGAVYSFDLKSNMMEQFDVNPEGFIYRTITDDAGQLWVGSNKGPTVVLNATLGSPGNFTVEDGLGSTSIWTTLEAQDGRIWIGTTNGIDVYNPEKEIIQHLSKGDGLVSNSGPTLVEDHEGRIWVGNNSDGINVIDPRGETLAHITIDQGLPDRETSAFFEERNGDMWVSSAKGLSIINPEKGLAKQVTNLAAWKGAFYYAIVPDSRNNLWVLSSSGVLVIDPDRKTMKFLNDSNGLNSSSANSILEDSRGNIWIGGLAGIDVVNAAQDSITTITTSHGLADNGIYTLNERNGKIYAGTTNGLSIIAPHLSKNNRLAIQTTNLGKAQGLGALDFAQNSAMFTKGGQYWAGVETQVLLVMDSLQLDSSRSTPRIAGVNFFDQRNDFRNRSSLTADDYLIRSNIQWDSVETTFYIPYNLVVPYDQNYISFYYSAMQLSHSDKIRYRYMLEGIDKKWSPITDNTLSENYRDLPPGKYTFKVASRGINGRWSKPASFSFVITAPWWRTWWAYTLYALGFFGIMTSFARYRSLELQRQNQILEEKVVSRTNALQKSVNDLQETQKQLIQSEKMASLGELTAGIAHEIQNPLNFVNNFSEVNTELIEELKKELTGGNYQSVEQLVNDIKANSEKINFHGKRAADIVKSMLQHSRKSSGQKEPIDINALCDEYLRLAYHGLRAKDKSFNAKFETDLDPNLPKVNVISQDMGRVVLNLINNAFYAVSERAKSQAGTEPAIGNGPYQPTVTVLTKSLENGIEIRVKDNGTGIPEKVKEKIFQPFFTTKPTGQGTGLGLSLSYDIVKAHGGELRMESREGEGTEFIISLPVV